ncbi:MAG: oligopeptidase A, partial [Legionella sp. 21-45-4]
MVQLLNKKNQLVQMLGFEHYAAYSLATKMLNTPNQVIDFLEDLLHKARPKAEQEYQDLLDFSRIHLHLETLHPWDIAYVSQLKKEHDHTINDEALRAYFPLPHVMQGLFKIIHTLFGIQLREITTSELDTWHSDVRCFALFDSNKNTRGYLYMDLFARPNKRSGAWMDSLQTRYKKAEDSLQLPIATLTCNFANTTGQKPATLSHDEVITLFHEMGHCLHHLLTQVNYLSASGIHGVEWDAVELPSQWFENWCWTAEGMAILSAHIDTGETLPTALLTKLIASQQFQAALGLLRQIELALFDFKLHLHCPQNPENGLEIAATIPAILSEIQQSTRLTPAPDFLRTAHSFSHIFAGGYAAGYYSYLWAEILSADA